MVQHVIVRMFGFDPDAQTDAMSEEEIKIIINNSYNRGEINQTELDICRISFSFDERHAKDIMVPRTQMITLNEPFNVDELLETIKEHQFTRHPITEDGIKTMSKDLLTLRNFNRICFRKAYQNCKLHS